MFDLATAAITITNIVSVNLVTQWQSKNRRSHGRRNFCLKDYVKIEKFYEAASKTNK